MGKGGEAHKALYELEESWIKIWEEECNGRCAILHTERCPRYDDGECRFPDTDMAKRLVFPSYNGCEEEER